MVLAYTLLTSRLFGFLLNFQIFFSRIKHSIFSKIKKMFFVLSEFTEVAVRLIEIALI